MRPSPVLSPLTDRTQPLLRRSALLPGESLASLLERVAQLNFYPNSKTLTSIYRARLAESATPDDLMRPTRCETFEQLACLTLVSPDDLHAASDHGFAPILTPPGAPPTTMAWTGATTKPLLLSRWARLYLRYVTAAQFCPQCLKAVICQGILIQLLLASSSMNCRQGDPPVVGKQLHPLSARCTT